MTKLLAKEANSLLMKYFQNNAKNRNQRVIKLLEVARKDDNKNIGLVVDRYLRFVQDQYSFTWLCWRHKVAEMQLSKKEIKNFNTKMSFRKAKGYKLRRPIGNEPLSDRGEDNVDLLTELQDFEDAE